jgi:chorismate mutase
MSADPRATELERLRAEIDAVDRAIVEAFARRVAIARQIGDLKEDAGQPVLDPSREAAVVRRAAERAREAGLDVEAVREVFWRLVGLSRRTQRDERGSERG